MSTLPNSIPVLVPADEREDTERRNIKRRKMLATLFVLTLALCSRLIVVWYTLIQLPPGWLFTRGLEMDLLAKSLLAGHGFSSPFGSPPQFQTGPTAMIAPGYPFFVAAVFHVFGIDSVASSLAILAIHIALNMATVWLILHLGRSIAREDAAVLAACIWACSLPLIWLPTIFWETSFSAFFLLGFVALARELTGESGRMCWIAAGAACAIAGLFNPALLPSLLGLIAWAAYKNSRMALGKPALAFLAFLVVFSPWPIRNARVFHAFIATRTTVGLELWMGNRPGATGFLDESFFPAFNAAELADYRQRGELGYFANKATIAKQFIRANPLRFILMSAVRVKRFWTGTGNGRSHVLFAWHATGTLVLGMLGFMFLRRCPPRQGASFFLIPLVLFPMPYYITHAEFRYRLVLDPLLCVLTAYALHHLTSPRTRSHHQTGATE